MRERVHLWLQEELGADAVRSGRVAPVWREVEREISHGFQPTVSQVTRDPAAGTIVKQLDACAPAGERSTPRSYDGSHDFKSDQAQGFAMFRGQQVAAAHAAYEAPREWHRVEIESEVDADGRLINLRVAFPSGIHELDRAALDAVRAALERRPPKDGHTRARWGVEAGTAVAPAGGGRGRRRDLQPRDRRRRRSRLRARRERKSKGRRPIQARGLHAHRA